MIVKKLNSNFKLIDILACPLLNFTYKETNIPEIMNNNFIDTKNRKKKNINKEIK
jgi:hypothetical protein